MVNKRKRTPPKRWVPLNRRYPSWLAMDLMYKHNRLQRPNEIDELRDLVGEANERYHDSPLQWPFDLDNSQLKRGITHAKKTNFFNNIDQIKGKPGWWNPTPTQEQEYWKNYNNAVIHDYGKHLNFNEKRDAYEVLDNHVLRKFRW